MGDYLAQLEAQFAKLMAMGSYFEETSRVAILLSSLVGQYKFVPLGASINTASKDEAAWL